MDFVLPNMLSMDNEKFANELLAKMEEYSFANGANPVHKHLVQLPTPQSNSPPGFTSVVLLDESHVTAHCYADMGLLAIDVFTCGSTKCEEIMDDITKWIQLQHPDATFTKSVVMHRFP